MCGIWGKGWDLQKTRSVVVELPVEQRVGHQLCGEWYVCVCVCGSGMDSLIKPCNAAQKCQVRGLSVGQEGVWGLGTGSPATNVGHCPGPLTNIHPPLRVCGVKCTVGVGMCVCVCVGTRNVGRLGLGCVQHNVHWGS